MRRDPEHLTQEFSKADRGGRILVDTGRNGYSATFAAAYAVRAKPGAPVSAPCTWDELERGEVAPRTFTLRTMGTASPMSAISGPTCRIAFSRCERQSRNCGACRVKGKMENTMNVHLVDGTYELFRHFFAMPSAKDARRK